MDVIPSTDEDDNIYKSKFFDENLNENERFLIQKLISTFPDPHDFVIGFSCTSSVESRRDSIGLSSSSNHKAKYSPRQESQENNHRSSEPTMYK